MQLSVMLQLIILLKKLHIMRKNKYSFILLKSKLQFSWSTANVSLSPLIQAVRQCLGSSRLFPLGGKMDGGVRCAFDAVLCVYTARMVSVPVPSTKAVSCLAVPNLAALYPQIFLLVTT